MILSTPGFGQEFLYPQLHHVMDFPFPYNSFIHAPVLTKIVLLWQASMA